MDQIKSDLKSAFVCKFEGELKEYAGNKIDFSQNAEGLGIVKFTQPVLIQKLEDEFELPKGALPRTPAVASQVLSKHGNDTELLGPTEAMKYQSGMALCMYKMQWSHPDIYNATRDCAWHMFAPYPAHQKALDHLMKYIIGTKNRGLVLSSD